MYGSFKKEGHSRRQPRHRPSTKHLGSMSAIAALAVLPELMESPALQARTKQFALADAPTASVRVCGFCQAVVLVPRFGPELEHRCAAPSLDARPEREPGPRAFHEATLRAWLKQR